MPILANVSVRQAMAPPKLVMRGGSSLLAACHKMESAGVSGAPVVDDKDRFEGTVALSDLLRIGRDRNGTMDALVDESAPTVVENEHLDVAVDAMGSAPQHWVSVLNTERNVVGTIATSDVVRGYRQGLLASIQRMNAEGGPSGTDRVRIGSSSPLLGQPLRKASLPISIIVTAIQRKRDLVVPSGDMVIEAGDELVLIGPPAELDAFQIAASAGAANAAEQCDLDDSKATSSLDHRGNAASDGRR